MLENVINIWSIEAKMHLFMVCVQWLNGGIRYIRCKVVFHKKGYQ